MIFFAKSNAYASPGFRGRDEVVGFGSEKAAIKFSEAAPHHELLSEAEAKAAAYQCGQTVEGRPFWLNMDTGRTVYF